ncbi:MAG: hypothetical protein ACI8PB_003721 [Desulforhopalus sp.]|jgi:hypothetical protein
MKRMSILFALILSLFSFCIAQAEEKGEMVELLFVQNSHDVTLEKGKLTLKKVSPTTIFFTDRPERIAGHMTTKDFVDEWSEGGNSFKADPPNAALSVFGKDEIVDIEVTLMNPQYEGDDLVYDIAIIEEDLKAVSGQSSLFIDPIGRPMSPTSVAGVHRRERRRAVRHTVR